MYSMQLAACTYFRTCQNSTTTGTVKYSTNPTLHIDFKEKLLRLWNYCCLCFNRNHLNSWTLESIMSLLGTWGQALFHINPVWNKVVEPHAVDYISWTMIKGYISSKERTISSSFSIQIYWGLQERILSNFQFNFFYIEKPMYSLVILIINVHRLAM